MTPSKTDYKRGAFPIEFFFIRHQMVFSSWLKYPRALENASFGFTSVCAYALSVFTILFAHGYLILLLFPFHAMFTGPQSNHLNFLPKLARENYDAVIRSQVEIEVQTLLQEKNEKVANIVSETLEKTLNKSRDALILHFSEASKEQLQHFESVLGCKSHDFCNEAPSDEGSILGPEDVDMLDSNDKEARHKLTEEAKATFCLNMKNMLVPMMKQLLNELSEEREKSYKEVLDQVLEEFHSGGAEIVGRALDKARKRMLFHHALDYPWPQPQYVETAKCVILLLFTHDVLFFVLFHRSKAHAILFCCTSALYYLETLSTIFLLVWASFKYYNHNVGGPYSFYTFYLFGAAASYYVTFLGLTEEKGDSDLRLAGAPDNQENDGQPDVARKQLIDPVKENVARGLNEVKKDEVFPLSGKKENWSLEKQTDANEPDARLRVIDEINSQATEESEQAQKLEEFKGNEKDVVRSCSAGEAFY